VSRKFLDQDEFRRLAAEGRERGSAVMTPSARVLRTVDDDNRIVRFVFSDGSTDRMNDRINPDGWSLGNYRANPVVLFAHNSEAPPIGRARNVHSDGTRLLGDVEFMPPEISEFADSIYKMVRGGYLKSGSVGFLPGSYRFADDESRPYGIDFTSGHELLEFSIVPVPALPTALIDAAAKGLIGNRDLALFREHARARTTRSVGAPVVAARPRSTLDYAGTAHQRRLQLDWAEANSPEGRARRRRIVQVRRHQASLLR
jgi:phage head maturation protease